MQITKANKLPEAQYIEMLNVAKQLRSKITKLNKGLKTYRVYTEARKGGLRSKMELGKNKVNIDAIQKLANKTYPHLDIQIKRHDSKWAWSNSGVCIFIKVKNQDYKLNRFIFKQLKKT